MAFNDIAKETQYKNGFARNNCDRISLTPPKDEGQRIRQAAASAGQSVSAYILLVVRDRMEVGR